MNSAKRIKTLVVYGYGIELVLAVLSYATIWKLDWLKLATKFLDDSAGSWATFFGLVLAGAMAARLVFFSLNTSDFSAWLEWKKLGGIVSGAFLFNLLLFLGVTATCVTLTYLKGTWLTTIGVLIGILGLINCLTFPLFVHRLSRLQAVFNYEFKRAIEAEKGK